MWRWAGLVLLHLHTPPLSWRTCTGLERRKKRKKKSCAAAARQQPAAPLATRTFPPRERTASEGKGGAARLRDASRGEGCQPRPSIQGRSASRARRERLRGGSWLLSVPPGAPYPPYLPYPKPTWTEVLGSKEKRRGAATDVQQRQQQQQQQRRR